MKRIIIILITFSIISQFLYGEENRRDSLASVPQVGNMDTPSLIIPTGKYFGKSRYQNIYGNPIGIFELWDLAAVVPQNKNIISAGKASTVIGSTFGIIGLVALLANAVCVVIDYDNPVVVNQVLPITFTSTLILSIITGDVRDIIMEKAVHNYNIYNLNQ